MISHRLSHNTRSTNRLILFPTVIQSLVVVVHLLDEASLSSEFVDRSDTRAYDNALPRLDSELGAVENRVDEDLPNLLRDLGC